jgi:hypothetical protein
LKTVFYIFVDIHVLLCYMGSLIASYCDNLSTRSLEEGPSMSRVVIIQNVNNTFISVG